MILSAPFEPEVRNRFCSTMCANFGFGALRERGLSRSVSIERGPSCSRGLHNGQDKNRTGQAPPRRAPYVGERPPLERTSPNGGAPRWRAALVAAGDGAQRRAHARSRRLHLEGPQADRRVIEAVGRTKPAAQSRSISLRALHAHLLHQSRRQESAGRTQAHLDAGEGRVAQTVRKRIAIWARRWTAPAPQTPLFQSFLIV
jgi:hypothetical protein